MNSVTFLIYLYCGIWLVSMFGIMVVFYWTRMRKNRAEIMAITAAIDALLEAAETDDLDERSKWEDLPQRPQTAEIGTALKSFFKDGSKLAKRADVRLKALRQKQAQAVAEEAYEEAGRLQKEIDQLAHAQVVRIEK